MPGVVFFLVSGDTVSLSHQGLVHKILSSCHAYFVEQS